MHADGGLRAVYVWFKKNRNTRTVHTSAKARLTGVAIRIRIRIRDPDRHQNLIICLVADCQPSLNISCKSVSVKLLKYKQTNNDDYITQ